jgi:hypothetical protein
MRGRKDAKETLRGLVTWSATLALSIATSSSDAAASSNPHDRGTWFSVGALGGSWIPAASFSDYQLESSPQPAWGLQALVGHGSWSAGLRGWRATTTQDLGSAAPSSAVHSTSGEVVGRARLGAWWGTELDAMASAGLLNLAWNPDRVTFDAGGTPVTVAFEPVTEWIVGGGLALRRVVARDWAIGFEVDHRRYALDTAHRVGGSIERSRETFGEWNARMELAWLHGRR